MLTSYNRNVAVERADQVVDADKLDDLHRYPHGGHPPGTLQDRLVMRLVNPA